MSVTGAKFNQRRLSDFIDTKKERPVTGVGTVVAALELSVNFAVGVDFKVVRDDFKSSDPFSGMDRDG